VMSWKYGESGRAGARDETTQSSPPGQLLLFPVVVSDMSTPRTAATAGPVPAENSVRAGQAAWWYSLGMPPSRCRRWMSRSATWAWFVVGCGSCRSGRALAIP